MVTRRLCRTLSFLRWFWRTLPLRGCRKKSRIGSDRECTNLVEKIYGRVLYAAFQQRTKQVTGATRCKSSTRKKATRNTRSAKSAARPDDKVPVGWSDCQKAEFEKGRQVCGLRKKASAKEIKGRGSEQFAQFSSKKARPSSRQRGEPSEGL